MTDLMVGGVGVVGGGYGAADIYVDGSTRVVQLISPVGVGEPLIRATFRVRHISSVNQDLQFEVASDAAFATIISSTTLTNRTPLTIHSWTMGVDLTPGVKVYWRVRAGDSGGGSWGAWVSSFTVYQTGAFGYEYVWQNVGTIPPDAHFGHEYVWQNVGVLNDETGIGHEYSWQNISVIFTDPGNGYEYVWLNNDDSVHPEPHIWFVEPTSGRPNDGITIIGFGFGALQSDYTSLVEVDLGDGSGWQTVGVVSWQRFPADPDMYGPDREIRVGKIDPQHDEVGILIPALAIVPGMLVRIRETT